jgi:hypothetical protein
MTGSQLKEALRRVGYSQADFAVEIKKSQKAVSLWVTGSGDVPDEIVAQVHRLIDTKFPGEASAILEQIAHPPFASEVHSWPDNLFDLLWKDAEKRKRIKRVIVDATIDESEPSFARCVILMHFHEFDLGPNERLYLDHLALPVRARGGPADKGTEWNPPILLRPQAERTQIKVDEDISDKLGPHAVGYELYNADRLDKVTVKLEAERGLLLSEFDAVGFPLYGDLLIESLVIKAHFLGLQPEPDPPNAQTYLIRRTAFRSRPSGLASDLPTPTREQDASGVHYSFGPLLRPRGGYGYCLSWAKLIRASQRRR